MHIPSADTVNIHVTGFDKTLYEYENSVCRDFSKEDWIYLPCRYSDYRYVLGTRGENPLICVGVNPSTAMPGSLDNTLKSVERIATVNGYDSFIMFNVYAQRATRPDDMDAECNMYLHRENMKAFEYLLKQTKNPSVWAAWGTVIEKRPYLYECVSDMIAVGEKYGVRWFTAGKCSKCGHPHHPLYLKKNSSLDEFDINNYIQQTLLREKRK